MHGLADDDTVDDDGNIHRADGEIELVAPCAYADPLVERKARRSAGAAAAITGGWREAAYWHAPADVGYFFSTGRVPFPPAKNGGQWVYLFSALEDESETNIIQPILQYGANPWYGGNYWMIASWFGGSYWKGNYYWSAPKRVNTGDFVDGEMAGLPPPSNCTGGCDWVVSTWTSTAQTLRDVHTPLGWRYVFGGVLEAYDVGACNELPTYDYFTDFDVEEWQTGTRWTPTWSSFYGITGCGEHITDSSSIVNLYY